MNRYIFLPIFTNFAFRRKGEERDRESSSRQHGSRKQESGPSSKSSLTISKADHRGSGESKEKERKHRSRSNNKDPGKDREHRSSEENRRERRRIKREKPHSEDGDSSPIKKEFAE